MITSLRRKFNAEFTQEKYRQFLDDLNSRFPGAIDFRVAETVLYIPSDFKDKLLDACDHIVDVITSPGFKELTDKAVPREISIKHENDHSHFIAFDFGICINESGEYEPQLIEMQGFPSLFAFEVLHADIFNKHYPRPERFSSYLNHIERDEYISLLREVILGDEKPEQVILLEIFPHQQKTRIDFYCTEDLIGIKTVCLTELILEGKKLFYLNNGQRTEIRRIYNRLIFDDLFQQPEEVREKGKILFQDLDVHWCPHPNWFYRISKYTLPFIRHPYVPTTYFLNDVKQIPPDLEHYVLKPLFSFAGQGVIIDVTREDIEQVNDPENWILQKKVNYADVIETPDVPAKAEIRIFYFWKDGAPRPVPVKNLARLSKGKMVGVRYNQDKEWVGGSFCLFEK